MRVQEREKNLLEFLDIFRAASTSQIQKLFYTGMKPSSAKRKAQERLSLLHGNKLVKRDRSDLNSEYIYYQKKTQFLYHQVLLVDVYLSFLRMKGKLLEFTPEVAMGDIRPDAKVLFDDGRYTHLILVEIHRNNAFNQEKYEDFYRTGAWRNHLPAFPKILVVSDRKIKLEETKLPYYLVPNDLKGIERVIS